MALVELEELKTVLGVGDLYGDEPLEQVIDAASDIILSMLVRWRVPIVAILADAAEELELRTLTPHRMVVGQDVTVSGLANHHNGQHTVLRVPEPDLVVLSIDEHEEPETTARPVIPNGWLAAHPEEDYEGVAAVREAALAIAVDVWQSRVAPGGQLQAVDFTPGPYRLGRSLISRVQGLLGPYLSTGTMVG